MIRKPVFDFHSHPRAEAIAVFSPENTGAGNSFSRKLVKIRSPYHASRLSEGGFRDLGMQLTIGNLYVLQIFLQNSSGLFISGMLSPVSPSHTGQSSFREISRNS